MLPFVWMCIEPHPQVQPRLGFFSVIIDVPDMFSGFDMCQNVLVKSRRPSGVNERIAEIRNADPADLTMLFIILEMDW